MDQKYEFELLGRIVFDIEDVTKKHMKQSSWKRIAMVVVDNIDFCKYYCWFIKKRYNLELQIPLRGLHFTIINDKVSEVINYDLVKKLYDGKIISLQYGVDPKCDDYHWWLPVQSKDAEEIRKLAGLSPKPYWGFHITIGRADGDLRLEHSTYIHRMIKNFGVNYK